jgi:hypothetical protein
MNLEGVLKGSVLTIRRHAVLAAPSVISLLLVALIVELSFRSNVTPAATPGAAEIAETTEGVGRVVMTSVVNVFFQIFSQTVTVAMADDVVKTGRCSLRAGFYAAYPKLMDILVTAVALVMPPAVCISLARAFPDMDTLCLLAALAAGLGLAFYFMFAVTALAIEDLNAPDAMLKSIALVRGNSRDAIRLFLSVAAAGLFAAAASLVFSGVPVLGYPVYVAASGIYMAFTSVVFLMSYRALNAGAAPRVNAGAAPPRQS